MFVVKMWHSLRNKESSFAERYQIEDNRHVADLILSAHFLDNCPFNYPLKIVNGPDKKNSLPFDYLICLFVFVVVVCNRLVMMGFPKYLKELLQALICKSEGNHQME